MSDDTGWVYEPFICKWLREYGPASELDPDDLEFIFIHDPSTEGTLKP